jgi:REP element-mobilizing transposase RayT
VDQIADEHGWDFVAKEVMPGHVHLFVRVEPTDAPAAVVRAFKAKVSPRSAMFRSRRCAATSSISGTR